MGTMELETYGKALAAIKRNKAILPSWKSIAISHSRHAGQDDGAYANATLRDVAHALWKRRSVIHAHILVLRTASLPCDAEQARRLGRQLTKHFDRHNPPDRKMQRKRNLGLRSLRIVNGKDMHDSLSDVAALAYRHGTLASIVLQNIHGMPTNADPMQALGFAISLSNLRVVNLANAHLGPRSLVCFLDNLHTPCLSHLSLSGTVKFERLQGEQTSNPLWQTDKERWSGMRSWEVWKEEMEKLTGRLITLVQRGSGDRRSAPYAPRLEWLTFNDNDLGNRNASRVAYAVMMGNFCLETVELRGVETKDRELHLDVDEYRGSLNMTDTFELREVKGICSAVCIIQSQYLIARIRARIAFHKGPDYNRPARGSLADAEDRTAWRVMELKDHLQDNFDRKWAVKDASRRLLPVLRTLTCKSREANMASDEPPPGCVFPFAKLPPELCERVVDHIDDMLFLHPQQRDRLISFAADPTTIGYGHDPAFHGLTQAAQSAIHAECAALERGEQSKKKKKRSSKRHNGLLLRGPFCWGEMLALRSVPLDWKTNAREQVSLDYARRAHDPYAAEDFFEHGVPGEDDDPPNDRYLYQNSEDQLRLLQETGLQAFWEATGTYAPEV